MKNFSVVFLKNWTLLFDVFFTKAYKILKIKKVECFSTLPLNRKSLSVYLTKD